MKLRTLAPLLAAVLGACGSDDPADVAGNYSIALTNRENGCQFDPWVEGETAQNIAVVITQSGAQASADVQPSVARVLLDFSLGAHVFTGPVDGDDVTLTIVGTRAASQNACAYTYDAEISGTLTGDVLEGNLRYKARTNASPDCGALTGCETRQQFNGTRPPT